jgi:tocopherol O-methyltransferase
VTPAPQFPVVIDRIRMHYDRLSFLYRYFWGEHLHHGYWEKDESVPRAQIQLMERLADRAGIPKGAQVLDIGCGLGGSALWLADKLECDVTGMTISPVQARMATAKAKSRGFAASVRFEVNDADTWQPKPASFDVIWIVESSEHFHDKPDFFQRCARALKPGGILAVCAWLRREGPVRDNEKELVDTIAEAMLSASLGSLSDYRFWMQNAGLIVTAAQDITRNVEPTWTHCSRIGRNPIVKFLLPFTDQPTQRFVRSFPLMEQAYTQGAMAFGLLVAQNTAKPATQQDYGAGFGRTAPASLISNHDVVVHSSEARSANSASDVPDQSKQSPKDHTIEDLYRPHRDHPGGKSVHRGN